MNKFSIGREPALTLIGVAGPLVALLVSFTDMAPEARTALIAAAVAVAGVATAMWVHRERLAPALLGLAQAVLTLALGFGWDLSPEQQAGWMTVVGIVVAAFVRTQVVAKVDELGDARGRAIGGRDGFPA